MQYTQVICKKYTIPFLLLLLLVPAKAILAQDKSPVNFGKIDKEDFSIKSGLVNATSSAVVIADIGTTKFEGNKNAWFSYIFKRQRRIKIIDKRSYDLATVSILLYNDKESAEKAEDITATTYNLEGGKIAEMKLNAKDVFTEKVDKNHSVKKFTLPNVKEGAIIEYSYTVKSDFIFHIPAWQFQDKTYPTLWSEYNITLPGLLSYMSSHQGRHPFLINKATDGFQTFLLRRKLTSAYTSLVSNDEAISVSSPVVKQKWVKKDLAPFTTENFISSPNNYIDRISFQLFKTYDGESFHDVANNWKVVTRDIMERDDFGKPITESNYLIDEIVQQVVSANDTELQAARKIYYYVQENYTCTDHHDLFITTSLRDVIKKKSGNVADLNLLMVAMLKRRVRSALPVLLSTTEYGRNSANYPEMDRLNYVIGKIKIDAQEYFLDATIPFLPFGKLPANCYNGHARVISEDTAAVYLETEMLKENSSATVFMQLNDNNEMEGFYTKNHGLYKSVEARNSITKSPEAYKTSISKQFPEEFDIRSVTPDSLKRTEDLVRTVVDFKLKPFEDVDIIYFNPMIIEGLKANPFHADERTYPVEMPYATNDAYVLNMPVPKGYKVEELPKSTRLTLNDKEGLFEYLIKTDGKMINMSARILINQTNFTPEDYQTLRDFFSHVVKKYSEQIVFKKIQSP